MTIGRPARDLDTPTLLRRGVLALAALGIGGTIVELVFLHHWSTATALIVWPVMGMLALAFGLLVSRPSRRVIDAVRVLAVIAGLFGLVGVGLHVAENLNTGPLDRNFAATWDGLSTFDQWFAAITGQVGPSPVLAPGAIIEIALALLLGTIRHPSTS